MVKMNIILVIEKIVLVIIGATIGIITNIVLDCWRKIKERKEMAKLFRARIKSQLEVGDYIEKLLREDRIQQIREEIDILIRHFDRDDVYKAFVTKIGLYPLNLIEKIMEYFDYLNLYKKNLKLMVAENNLSRWQGFYMAKIIGIECLILLNKDVLKDKKELKFYTNLLREEYCKRFIPVIKKGKEEGLPVKDLEEIVKRIEVIFQQLKMSDELKC